MIVWFLLATNVVTLVIVARIDAALDRTRTERDHWREFGQAQIMRGAHHAIESRAARAVLDVLDEIERRGAAR